METKIIIPNLDNDGSSNADVLDRAIGNVCTLFGGATVYAAKGYWLNDEGRLYEDEVSVIVSASTDGDAAVDALRSLARDVLAVTDQEAVFISVGGKAEIIE
ncbi:molybdenum cofactor biosynthesis protein MoaE [Acuticoccus sediminis]|uniref:Molybdenum cofactor biosynthesis protein MoaE n=1 Tax=Acuticoccus sediminis TaxID=2184697 RepID=A0A8B2NXH8_9HYPH|nr:molybdenum cofactor biosynthesis protein MoaE [Acuticoccus sediminis]RAI01081.1 molybdenum cofactor biosynthesis protein MoaE [Acuticoccus sediminis]